MVYNEELAGCTFRTELDTAIRNHVLLLMKITQLIMT